MTHEEFISLVKQPAMVEATHAIDLKEMVNLYPYFAPARLFHAKALQQSNSVLFKSNLKFAALYAANRNWLYYYIHPDKKIAIEPYKRAKSTTNSGDYFDMINAVESEGGDTKRTLKNLAEKLKSAREMVVSTAPKPIVIVLQNAVVETEIVEVEVLIVENKLPLNTLSGNNISLTESDCTELNAKNLIKEHKYLQAIEILKVLNLNNPKKSVYFADQIRFLEKVIANSKK